MNLVGKILTVLIFVFSLIFMALTMTVYQTHKNWREVVGVKADAGLRGDLTREREKLTALETEKANLVKQLTDEKEAKAKALANLENKIKTLEEGNKTLADQLEKLKTSERDAVSTMASTQNETGKLREEVDGLKKGIEAAQKDRDEHFKQVQALTDQIHDRVNELKTLKDQTRTLTDDLARTRDTLRLFNLNENVNYKDTQAPPVDGKVLAVRSGGLVEISIGFDSGLRKGHKLEIYRVNASGSSYVGRIEVLETTPDRAVCKIDPKLLKSEVQNGDNVTSKLDR